MSDVPKPPKPETKVIEKWRQRQVDKEGGDAGGNAGDPAQDLASLLNSYRTRLTGRITKSAPSGSQMMVQLDKPWKGLRQIPATAIEGCQASGKVLLLLGDDNGWYGIGAGAKIPGNKRRNVERSANKRIPDPFKGQIKYVYALYDTTATPKYKVYIGGWKPVPVFVVDVPNTINGVSTQPILKIENLGDDKAIVGILLRSGLMTVGLSQYPTYIIRQYSVDGSLAEDARSTFDWEVSSVFRPTTWAGHSHWAGHWAYPGWMPVLSSSQYGTSTANQAAEFYPDGITLPPAAQNHAYDAGLGELPWGHWQFLVDKKYVDSGQFPRQIMHGHEYRATYPLQGQPRNYGYSQGYYWYVQVSPYCRKLGYSHFTAGSNEYGEERDYQPKRIARDLKRGVCYSHFRYGQYNNFGTNPSNNVTGSLGWIDGDSIEEIDYLTVNEVNQIVTSTSLDFVEIETLQPDETVKPCWDDCRPIVTVSPNGGSYESPVASPTVHNTSYISRNTLWGNTPQTVGFDIYLDISDEKDWMFLFCRSDVQQQIKDNAELTVQVPVTRLAKNFKPLDPVSTEVSVYRIPDAQLNQLTGSGSQTGFLRFHASFFHES